MSDYYTDFTGVNAMLRSWRDLDRSGGKVNWFRRWRQARKAGVFGINHNGTATDVDPLLARYNFRNKLVGGLTAVAGAAGTGLDNMATNKNLNTQDREEALKNYLNSAVNFRSPQGDDNSTNTNTNTTASTKTTDAFHTTLLRPIVALPLSSDPIKRNAQLSGMVALSKQMVDNFEKQSTQMLQNFGKPLNKFNQQFLLGNQLKLSPTSISSTSGTKTNTDLSMSNLFLLGNFFVGNDWNTNSLSFNNNWKALTNLGG